MATDTDHFIRTVCTYSMTKCRSSCQPGEVKERYGKGVWYWRAVQEVAGQDNTRLEHAERVFHLFCLSGYLNGRSCLLISHRCSALSHLAKGSRSVPSALLPDQLEGVYESIKIWKSISTLRIGDRIECVPDQEGFYSTIKDCSVVDRIVDPIVNSRVASERGVA